MPLYDGKCDNCEHEFEYFSSVDNRHNVRCPNCSGPTHIMFNRVNIVVDQTLGYYDNQLGRYVESSSHRRRIARELGLEPYSIKESDSVARDIEKTRQHLDNKAYEQTRKILSDADERVRTVTLSDNEPAVA